MPDDEHLVGGNDLRAPTSTRAHALRGIEQRRFARRARDDEPVKSGGEVRADIGGERREVQLSVLAARNVVTTGAKTPRSRLAVIVMQENLVHLVCIPSSCASTARRVTGGIVGRQGRRRCAREWR